LPWSDDPWNLRGTSFGLLAIAGLAAAYVPRLQRSLWLDETITLWEVQGGLVPALIRTAHVPGHSLIYAAVSSLFLTENPSARDLLLRIPALASVVLLCWFLYRLAEDSLGTGAGKVAVVVGAFHPFFIEFGTQARPYSMAMAAVTASMWTLFRWIRDGERRWLLWWVAATVCVVYMHFMFLPVLAAQLVYILVERKRLAVTLAASLAVLALCLPLIPLIRLVVRQAPILVFVPAPPGWLYLIYSMVPFSLSIALIAVGAIVWRYRGEAVRCRLSWLGALSVWWLVGPLLLFALSRNSEMRVFVSRYFAYSAPAFALLITALGVRLFGARKAAVWALASALLATVFTLGSERAIGPEELGPAMKLLSAEAPSTPVIFVSDVPESNSTNWKDGLVPDNYLFTPLVAYPIRNRIVPLPRLVEKDGIAYLKGTAASDFRNSDRVLLISRSAAWISVVKSELQPLGFTAQTAQPNNFAVVTFERATPH
jgi:hypothetical protein